MGKDVPGIKMDNLVAWFRANVAEVQDLEARLIGHGRSNLTYKLEAPDGRAWVLRRPPLSHVQPTAHDMAREFRVLSALKDTEVPVPRPLAFCGDAEVIGAQLTVRSEPGQGTTVTLVVPLGAAMEQSQAAARELPHVEHAEKERVG